MNRFLDPALLRASPIQLRQMLARGAARLAALESADAARTELVSIAQAIPPDPVETMDVIARRVALETGVTVRELLSPDLSRRVSRARVQAYAEIVATGRYSLLKIARHFNRRNHTTVFKCVRAYRRREGIAADE